MGYWKDRQIRLVESGYTFDQANRALTRQRDTLIAGRPRNVAATSAEVRPTNDTRPCPTCGESTYRDLIPTPSHGGSQFHWRHDATDRIVCACTCVTLDVGGSIITVNPDCPIDGWTE